MTSSSKAKTPAQDAPISIADLLVRARAHIEAGENRMRQAAEDIAAASDRGATQRAIAESVGKSPMWVNGLLQWHRDGYQEATPFGPAAKAARDKAVLVQSTVQPESKPAPEVEPISDAAAMATAAAEAARIAKEWRDRGPFKPSSPSSPPPLSYDQLAALEAIRLARAKVQAEAARARAEQWKQYADQMSEANKRRKAGIHSSDRTLLIKTLGMLSSNQAGERDNAAQMAEKIRARLGMSWEQLIVPATVTDKHKKTATKTSVH